MCFTIFQNDKTTFQAIKTTSLKSRKIEIFSKGLVHGYGPKMAIFSTFFLVAIQGSKMCFTIFQNKKTTSQAIKTTRLKSPKMDIFQRGQSMVLVQKWLFFNFFSCRNIGFENVFYDILERENDFLGYKNNKFEKSKN